MKRELITLTLVNNRKVKMSWVYTNYIKYPESKMKLGHRKASKQEIGETIARLNVEKKFPSDNQGSQQNGPKMSSEEIENMLQRLADPEKNLHRTPERSRTGSDKQMGLVNTYAWTDGRILQSHPKVADGNWY